MGFSRSFFAARFGVTERDLALTSVKRLAGGEYADLYFEYPATSSVTMAWTKVIHHFNLGFRLRYAAGHDRKFHYAAPVFAMSFGTFSGNCGSRTTSCTCSAFIEPINFSIWRAVDQRPP